MTKRIFIDDSILCKLFDDNSPVEQAAARNLIGDVENSTIVTSALSLANFYEEVTIRFTRSLEPVTAKLAVNDLTELTVVQLDSDLVLAATEIQTSFGVSMSEAITVEAALTSGCDFIVTEVFEKKDSVKGIQIERLKNMITAGESTND
ncbi:MAG: hypothetical protein VX797_03880 [Actinomycetota bacterium]|jgi:predicted nucleic acid-binding protein|nr:hypothetical protein [Acidimicrobiaceae bacterium]MCH2621223.1 PIN domain-containing protein [Acidimicrobiales bacterium]MEC7899115.1 hypothetical protein [Actinomycetota bacterium]|tara:strand:- start:250 stop:696 length:447 start_codon:yes stop_codon:yes gene_type:complete